MHKSSVALSLSLLFTPELEHFSWDLNCASLQDCNVLVLLLWWKTCWVLPEKMLTSEIWTKEYKVYVQRATLATSFLWSLYSFNRKNKELTLLWVQESIFIWAKRVWCKTEKWVHSHFLFSGFPEMGQQSLPKHRPEAIWGFSAETRTGGLPLCAGEYQGHFQLPSSAPTVGNLYLSISVCYYDMSHIWVHNMGVA